MVYRGTTGGLYRHDPSAYLTQLHPRVDGIVCVSEAVREDVARRVWKNKENVVIIYKGHELSWYTVPPTERSSFELKEGDVVAITAAHVRPSKGISVLLEATKYITAPNFHLVLAGSGFEPHFQEMEQSPIGDRIHFIGHRTDISSVGTATGGVPELVSEGKTGLIVPTSDIKALGKAINKLAHDKAKCLEMGEAAKQQLQNHFTSEVTVKKHLDYFNKLLMQQ